MTPGEFWAVYDFAAESRRAAEGRLTSDDVAEMRAFEAELEGRG